MISVARLGADGVRSGEAYRGQIVVSDPCPFAPDLQSLNSVCQAVCGRFAIDSIAAVHHCAAPD
jgi:hypothetical protein